MLSKLSSSISIRSASPPARLTPTLLCRMSSAPQRRRASAIAASNSAVLVTSAAMGRASNPSATINDAVSSARSSVRSSASTRAPSRAKRRATALPFPMPSPGLWPAPTTTATLPSSRRAEAQPSNSPPRAAMTLGAVHESSVEAALAHSDDPHLGEDPGLVERLRVDEGLGLSPGRDGEHEQAADLLVAVVSEQGA